jgi:hypothetical protein
MKGSINALTTFKIDASNAIKGIFLIQGKIFVKM